MKSEKKTAIERAKSILSSIPAVEKIDNGDFLAAIAGYIENQLKMRGKIKDPEKGFKYKAGFIDPTTGKKAGVRFKLKDGKITIKLGPSKKKKEKG